MLDLIFDKGNFFKTDLSILSLKNKGLIITIKLIFFSYLTVTGSDKSWLDISCNYNYLLITLEFYSSLLLYLASDCLMSMLYMWWWCRFWSRSQIFIQWFHSTKITTSYQIHSSYTGFMFVDNSHYSSDTEMKVGFRDYLTLELTTQN